MEIGMKKVLSVLIAIALVVSSLLSLAACGRKNDKNDDTVNNAVNGGGSDSIVDIVDKNEISDTASDDESKPAEDITESKEILTDWEETDEIILPEIP